MPGEKKQTLNPTVTGTSILGIKFEDGVVIAADLLGSYGSMAKLFQLPRLFKVNDQTVIGGTGDYADFQYLTDLIEDRVTSDYCYHDGYTYKPQALMTWCTRVLYNRRTKFNPLWNRLVIAGMQNTKPFLGCVDMLGNAYENDCIATGYGNYLALPLMREFLEKNGNKITKQQAVDILERCLKVLYYRDARAYDMYQIATITKDGVELEESKKLATNWRIAHRVVGYD